MTMQQRRALLRVCAVAVIASVVWGMLVFGFYQIARRPWVSRGHALAAAYERPLRRAAWTFWGLLTTLTWLAVVVFLRAQATQKALRQAEWLYRRLADISADVIVGLSPDGIVQFVSPKVLAYGYKPEEIVGKPATEFIAPEYHAQFAERLAALQRGQAVPASPLAIRTSDGQVAYGESRCFGVYEGQQLQSVWCSFHDLTDLLQLNRALQEQANALAQANEDWAMTYDAINAGIAVLDSDFTIVRANLALATLTGQPREALIGRKCWEILHPDATVAACPFHDMLRDGQNGAQEIALPDGRRWMVRAYPLVKDGALQRIVHTVRDVTVEWQIRQLTEQTHRLVTLGQMAAGIAHEINNPLNAIVGMAELLMESVSDTASRQLIAAIHEQALRIGTITRNLLTFARPRPQELTPVDVNGLVRHVISLSEPRCRIQRISVQAHLQDPLPPVLGDATQLQQVMLNLVTNACDAMSEAGGTLSISTVRDNRFVRIVVQDTGRGIPPEHLPHLFDPFFTTKPVGGGMGLAIVYSIVLGHGGRIWAENRPEGGARFVVELPAFIPETQQDTDPSATAAPSRLRLRILVVDDELPFATTLQALLGRDGHEVTVAGDGDAAIALLSQNDYDLILCDLHMPKVSGDGLHTWVCQHKPHLAARFVLMTGDFLHPAAQQAASEWHVRVLHKPFRIDELRALLHALSPVRRNDRHNDA